MLRHILTATLLVLATSCTSTKAISLVGLKFDKQQRTLRSVHVELAHGATVVWQGDFAEWGPNSQFPIEICEVAVDYDALTLRCSFQVTSTDPLYAGDLGSGFAIENVSNSQRIPYVFPATSDPQDRLKAVRLGGCKITVKFADKKDSLIDWLLAHKKEAWELGVTLTTVALAADD